MAKDETNAWLFYKICFTCIILAPTLGITAAVTGNSGFGTLALYALAGAGISFVIALLVGIWAD